MKLEDFVGLRINWRCFKNESTLRFFPWSNQDGKSKREGKANRVALVFGRNGSGKTTVSDAFSAIANKMIPADAQKIEVIAVNEAGNDVHVSNDELAELTSVFNEDYVRNKILIKERGKGLGAIVLFGEQGDLDTKITEETKLLEQVENEKIACEKLKTEYDDSTNSLSPDFITTEIFKILHNTTAKSGWAYRQVSSGLLANLPKVDESTITKVCQCTLEKTLEDCQDEFEKASKKYKELKQIPETLQFPHIVLNPDWEMDEDALVSTLNRTIEQATLSDRDKKIIELAQRFGTSWLPETINYLSNPSVDICPCCWRPLDSNEKSFAIEKIRTILSKEADEFRSELQVLRSRMPNVHLGSYDFTGYKLVLPDTVIAVQNSIVAIIDIIHHYREDIESRLSSLHEAREYANRGYAKEYAKLKSAIAELESKRIEIESDRAAPKALKQKLADLNLAWAKHEIADDYTRREKARADKRKNEETINTLTTKIQERKESIKKLEAKKSSIEIAAGRINAALAYIFLSKNRIQIKADGTDYKVLINGQTVDPSRVSVGERNALALCYFFSDIMQQCEEKKAYQKERLIILDDPISSFDHENKMGVLSYLMFEIENLTCTIYKDDHGNDVRPWTRIICLMHELHAFISLATSIKAHDSCRTVSTKIMQDLFALNCRNTNLECLINKKEKRTLDTINEYSRNYEDIFKYAQQDNPEENIHVGNQTRRILESFATFVFREGLDHLFFGELVKCKDEETAKRYNAHFKTLFTRFVVNDESHLQGRTRSLTNANALFPFVSDDDRLRAVRGSICLMYLIFPEHINSLTKNPAERHQREELIKKWLKEILDSSPVPGGAV